MTHIAIVYAVVEVLQEGKLAVKGQVFRRRHDAEHRCRQLNWKATDYKVMAFELSTTNGWEVKEHQ